MRQDSVGANAQVSEDGTHVTGRQPRAPKLEGLSLMEKLQFVKSIRKLTTITFRRNPFVQTTAIIVGLAALIFGLLLGRIRLAEDLARATAAYFFSLWSVRGLVTP